MWKTPGLDRRLRDLPGRAGERGDQTRQRRAFLCEVRHFVPAPVPHVRLEDLIVVVDARPIEPREPPCLPSYFRIGSHSDSSGKV
jgi:hypothetical protein